MIASCCLEYDPATGKLDRGQALPDAPVELRGLSVAIGAMLAEMQRVVDCGSRGDLRLATKAYANFVWWALTAEQWASEPASPEPAGEAP